ncbi:hypothetical protein [Dechloromonas sp. HYN0024]|uniref:hypothetical protein n=1 Tax=Dechloromonas sp. HYN0024 TaxID=2231055 RepID=UPI000E453471|nr:hypothetical protein [Dechloromonas sp. HYN0024]AXS79107.1 hypothetical protein HYN24_03090 [Dechloromonas sp. HYN0024]
MTELIRAFSIPLCAADPGPSDEQFAKRVVEAEKIVQATMPFATSLNESQLIRGLESKDGFLWRTFSLSETPQLSLDFDTQRKRNKKTPSVAHRMHSEIEQLREEAELSIIRVGDLERLATSLSHADTEQARQALENLSDHDQALWKLVHSKQGKRISISFEDREIGITMPMFQAYVAEDHLRHIRFQVTSVNKKSAKVTAVHPLDEEKAGIAKGKKKPKGVTQLKRVGKKSSDDPDNWFCLYAAEYRDHPVEATVRVALNMQDLSPSHLELVRIENISQLVSLTTSLHARLTAPSSAVTDHGGH